MASNRFATMLLRRTNKMTVILVYVALEWFLILVLLLNSLFSHLIVKYAEFFGLKPPCLWCTRIEHIIDPVNGNGNSHRDLLCEAHAEEVSKLGFCSIHRKLAESHDMCQDCFISMPGLRIKDLVGDGSLKCSCCDASLEHAQKEDHHLHSHPAVAEEEAEMIDESVQVSEEEASPPPMENPIPDLEYFLDHTGQNLVPVEQQQKRKEETPPNIDTNVETTMAVNGYGDEQSVIFHSKECGEGSRDFPLSQWPSLDDVLQEPSGKVSMKETHTDYAESEEVADVSIGTEIPDLDTTDEAVQIREAVKNDDDHAAEPNESEVPDTPVSVDGLSQLQKKMGFLEKRDSWTEESLDGSVTSELEISDGVGGGVGVATVESLRSALKAERRALKALYSELEEERNASAVAASQTMAMINRLQEEKAAMQMEALQYQRMMEEQSEYDQDALQLLNELMIKREKEKQELEAELRACRTKLSDYENARNRSGGISSSPSCSDGEEETTTPPSGAVLDLKRSFADFEEERISIFEELKFLETKLLRGESGLKGKSLLPLFDEIHHRHGNGVAESNGVTDHSEKKKDIIEEEMGHIYERLQALEADREFLKHCLNSVSHGGKGLDLLQQILQHLRDLRITAE